ncbi:hypothetical protein [Synechococcus phage S-B68]|nr:hypothetical protein [Synechococcus phage S-B68]
MAPAEILALYCGMTLIFGMLYMSRETNND